MKSPSLLNKIITVFSTLLIGLSVGLPAQAVPMIRIDSGGLTPMPIAIPAFSSSDATGSQLGRDIMGVVSADLERSGLFRPIPENAFIERPAPGQVLPNFPSWRQINAQALVIGSVIPAGSGQVKVTFRLWDVTGESQLTGKEFNTLTSNWRRVAHLVADEIYKRMTGEEGYFDSRVVYVAESGPAKRRVKRLAIMDQDGANHKFLTDGRSLVLTPRFAPGSQDILYMSYASKMPRVYLRDLQSGREEVVGNFKGMSFAPRYSADGQKVVMSIANNGATNIFEMNIRTRQMRQITFGGAINTSPSYSPDGQRIVFNSDRGGTQQLYVMNSDGSGVQRISFGDGRYATPVWSPRGDLIAFTKMKGGAFSIGVMRPDGSGDRILTNSWMDEGPTWAPNGRVIMFSREQRGGRTRLYSVDLTGYNVREVLTPMDASDPAWSPLLHL